MGTATAHPPEQHDVPHPEIPPHDPARDINTKQTAIPVVGSIVACFVIVWLLKLLFAVQLDGSRQEKVWEAPTTQLDALRATETNELSGGDGGKPLNDAVQAYIKR